MSIHLLCIAVTKWQRNEIRNNIEEIVVVIINLSKCYLSVGTPSDVSAVLSAGATEI